MERNDDDAERGSTEPPPSELMYAPAVNAGDFEQTPPGWEDMVAELGGLPDRTHEVEPDENVDPA